LVSDTEPFSDSSNSGSSFSSSHVPYGANHPARGPSLASARATDTDGSDTAAGLEPVRQKTKKRSLRDTIDSSDSTNKSRTAGSKRRKKTSEAYRQAIEIERESADEREAVEHKEETKKQALKAQESPRKRDP
jgi:hypothetical protein